jgi:type IV pilus assembly protein PilF
MSTRPVILLSILVLALGGCQTTGEVSQGGDTDIEKVRIQEAPKGAAETNVALGSAYMEKGKNDVALLKFRRALAEDPNLPSAHYGIALLYERLGQPALASKHYNNAISLDPLYSEAQNAYGVFLCKNKDYKQADLHFNQALKNPLYKTPAIAYTNAGFCALQDSKGDKAEQYLRKALQINKRNPAALFQMARITFDKNDYLKTRAYLQRYHNVAKPSPKSLLLGIRTEEKLGDRDAVASYKLLLKSEYPDSDEYHDVEKAP